MKVYLAGGISDTDRKKGQAVTAKKLIDMGYDVYAPALNDSINDKSNDPTPIDIYNGDIDRVVESDVFVVRISGGNEDGTLSEIGFISGWNEMIQNYNDDIQTFAPEYYHLKEIKIVAYSTNERMMTPQFWNGIASGGFNHLVAGMIDNHGIFIGGEEEMLKYMEELYAENK